MKILLDECVPRRFKDSLPGHDCQTVPEAGLAGQENGALLKAAEQQGFDVFLTIDTSIQHQQNFSGRRIAMLVIRFRSNHLPELLPHLQECLEALRSIKPGQIVTVGADPLRVL
jgi:uncharacterized protein DUF5615